MCNWWKYIESRQIFSKNSTAYIFPESENFSATNGHVVATATVKFRNAGYKAADIWHRRYGFLISCLTLKIPMVHWCTHGHLFNSVSFDISPVVFDAYCRLCFFAHAAIDSLQLILYHVLALPCAISCLNVTYLFPFLPHSVSDLWCEQT